MKLAPTSIKVFAGIVTCISILLFLLSVSHYVGEVLRRYAEFPNYSLLKDDHMISPFQLSYFVFLILLIAGFGMFKLRNWARILYLISITFIGLAYILLAIIAFNSNAIAIIVPLFVLIFSYYFLNRPKILKAFHA